jgi:hypothetical protein
MRYYNAAFDSAMKSKDEGKAESRIQNERAETVSVSLFFWLLDSDS